MTSMTMRERMLAVIRGEEHDRVPFVQYSGLAGPNEDIWKEIGRENMGLLKWVSPFRIEHPNCRIEWEEFESDGRAGRRTTIRTPSGRIIEERLVEPAYGSSHITSHFIQKPEDYRILIELLRDAVVIEDMEPLEQVIRDMGEDGLPHTSIGRTPFQQLWIQWVSIENLCLHMVDIPDVMHEVISLLADVQRKTFPIVARSPAPYVVFGDNITAPIIGEKYFREFCLPFYGELADILGDRPVFVHMDGDLKPIAKAISESKVRGLDSFSPPPDNDTSVAEAVAMWPQMRLWINFPSSIHLASPEKVYEAAMQLLDEGGHTGRLQIQISENVPKDVWRKSFPSIIRAINDFGRP